MKYRHLFFDLDHTLWDFNTNATATLGIMFEELELEKAGVHDLPLFCSHYLMHNERLWEKYRKGLIRPEELRWKRMWSALMEFKIGDEQLARRLGTRFIELLPSRNKLFPDTLETLCYLRDKGYFLHLITNGFEETQRHKIMHSGIAGFFKEIITSESCNSIKPKKEIFEFAMKKAGAEPRHSIMIGDSIEVDIIGAKNAGMDQVYMNHLKSACGIQPTYIVHSIRELTEIF